MNGMTDIGESRGEARARALSGFKSQLAFGPVPSRGAPWPEWRDAFTFWGYRLGFYLVLNVVEDPAWLALAFC